ncbi:MAG TPA: cellulase family glycosylhydrolase [Balneolales bacterium]|nr:cellulase family glycosylhydrolase [Balneolales bacterium]
MERGINIGNSLDAYPGGETSWGNPPIQKSLFTDLKNAGFDAVRIPVTWGYDGRLLTKPPYTIDSTFMARVDTVVTWALDDNLFVIINAHHEFWLKDTLGDVTWENPAHSSYVNEALARFDSLWSQIATHFRTKSDSLMFEILNEPNPTPQNYVDEINKEVLKIIRRTNPTRNVLFSGYMWSNSAQLVSAAIPDSSDKFLIGYYHSYDPWPFGLNGGTTSNANILSTIKSEMNQVTTWSQKNGIPVVMGEYAFVNNCAYNPRMYAYATVVDQALQHGVAPFVWDDGGTFQIFNRRTGTFNEIKDILINTYPESPTNLSINENSDGSVKLQWQNRNPESDSIMVQRGAGNAPHNGVSGVPFADYAKVGPTETVFVDSLAPYGSTYYYRLSVTMKDSTELQSYPIMIQPTMTGIDRTGTGTPMHFKLFDNYPNPFNPTTTIRYDLPASSYVKLKVYDVLGREVSTLVNKKESPGIHSVEFDGSMCASGMYLVRLTAGGHVMTIKMQLIK